MFITGALNDARQAVLLIFNGKSSFAFRADARAEQLDDKGVCVIYISVERFPGGKLTGSVRLRYSGRVLGAGRASGGGGRGVRQRLPGDEVLGAGRVSWQRIWCEPPAVACEP